MTQTTAETDAPARTTLGKILAVMATIGVALACALPLIGVGFFSLGAGAVGGVLGGELGLLAAVAASLALVSVAWWIRERVVASRALAASQAGGE